MKKFTIQYEELRSAVVERICDLIDGHNVPSKHKQCVVLQVPEDKQFNLDGGRYLTEITQTELIDNKGYSYFLDVLSLEQLCEIVDAISEACDF